MQNVIQAATVAAQLSAHRRAIMDTLVGCPVITTEEYDTAMQRTLACQDIATLQKWYRNTIREIARREEQEPETAPVHYATAEQKEEIIRLTNRYEISRAEKTRVLLHLNQYDYAAAAAVLAELWTKVLARNGASHYPAPPADGWSRDIAAKSYSVAA